MDPSRQGMRRALLHRRLGWVSLVAGATAALLSGSAATADAQTLREALARAYETNPTLLARRAEVRATDERVPQALSNWRPRVTTGASIGRTDVDSRGTGSVPTDAQSTPKSINLQVTQPVYRGGRTIAGTNVAEFEVGAARANLVATEQEVFLSASTAYLDVLRAEAVLILQINNEQRLERQLEATQDRFRVGEVTRTDVAQAESRLAAAKADRTRAEGDLLSARTRFERVFGFPPGQLSRPAAFEGLASSKQEAQVLAETANPSLIAQQLQQRAAEERIDLVFGELLPSVNLVGSALRSEDAAGRESETTNYTVEAQLSVPLYQSGSVSSRVREQKELANQRRILVEETRRTAVEQAATAFENWQSALAAIVSLQVEVETAEIALEGVEQEATVGARTVLDVLDAEQALLNSQVRLVTAERDAFVRGFELLVATGRMTATYLGLPVEQYDPGAHYRAVRNKWWGTRAPGLD